MITYGCKVDRMISVFYVTTLRCIFSKVKSCISTSVINRDGESWLYVLKGNVNITVITFMFSQSVLFVLSRKNLQTCLYLLKY